MKYIGKIFVGGVLALFCLLPNFAGADNSADRADDLLAKLAASFRAKKSYEVQFAITSGGYTSSGRYAVSGEEYYLTLGDAEVYGRGALRYEVDNRRKEVTINSVDTKSRNILNNPAHAFDFLSDEYSAYLVWERDGTASIRLTPTVKNASMRNTITVTLSTRTLRPTTLEYDYDGEKVYVAVKSIEPLNTPLKAYDKSAYSSYEMIDFR